MSWILVNLLRCEAPIEFDPATGWLTTMKERVGEDEDYAISEVPHGGTQVIFTWPHDRSQSHRFGGSDPC